MTDRTAWWSVFGLALLVGTVWSLASPPLSGPDEIEQGRRAAAVVRGQLTGREHPGLGNLVVDVRVPETYGDVSVDRWRCFLGPLVEGAPQEAMTLPPSTCPDLPSGSRTVEVQTVQYRGQPFFYAWVGLGTLVPGAPGTYLMRLLGLLPAAAFVASAASSTRRSGSPLAGLGLLMCLTPMVLYLAGSTNPSGLEIAAALSAWTTGMVLAARPRRATLSERVSLRSLSGQSSSGLEGRVLARFGLALVVLSLLRGLGPLFAALIVGGVAVVAGGPRVRELLRPRATWAWAAAIVAAVAASALWLAHIQSAWPLAERPGSGWQTAFGYLPWYLRQSVGVFGTNDSALSPFVTWAWVVAALAVIILGLATADARARVVSLGALVGGLAIQVTAEGLSLPPIGFFWQGRYALPLLLGAVVVATGSGRRSGPGAEAGRGDPLGVDDLWVDDAATTPAVAEGGRVDHAPSAARWSPATCLAIALVLFTVAVQAVALVTVLRHYGAMGGATLGVADALFDPVWSGPLPGWALLGLGLAASTVLALSLASPLVGLVARPGKGRAVPSSPIERSGR